MQPRGLRNRNPGNLRQSPVRYRGEVVPSNDVAFKEFETMAWGYRALIVLLQSYRKRGLRTLRAMICRYAPPTENATEAYIARVAAATGLAPDAEIDTSDRATMLALAAAISAVENGVPACADDVAAGWKLAQEFRA